MLNEPTPAAYANMGWRTHGFDRVLAISLQLRNNISEHGNIPYIAFVLNRRRENTRF